MSEKPYFLHESSYIDNDVVIGEGTKIWHFSHIQQGAKIGKHCTIGQNVNIGNNVIIGNRVKIQNNVSVYEGAILEDYVFCGPSTVFTNIMYPRSAFPQRGSKFYKKTLIKRGASLGANSTVICGNTIGKYAFVGAGAVVTKDVPDYALVAGNPAKIIGWICSCGTKLGLGVDFSMIRMSMCSKCKVKYKREGLIVEKIT